ncbi:Acyl-CoA dehydrogenase [Loktanella atrilutea]|uniref:Acyl-CoA dehydrogenase n=1 Tax=Loktanella atrilutea TaxID=366533 RepID=A0A1M4WWQ5_LOKAT|nr:acyl-CoA dehydrogenase family protein [Loktanella atrilutea]SHE85721.1 Acyl-CoA dehydrogenase [Loktanella atrilutea]
MLIERDPRPGSADAAPTSPDPTTRLARTLAASAAAEEAGTTAIAGSLRHLRDAGWLDDDGTADPVLTARRLQRVGAANLPVGRLWEGHMNALYLANVHGDSQADARVRALVADGAILGVWGADGPEPVAPGPHDMLMGHKLFASGLGTVTHAVITVSSGPRVRLALVAVNDTARADANAWQMSGMRSTDSGRYDFDGTPLRDVIWLGGAGDYVTEPHFVGGVWRIAALQVGAALGLLESAAAHLRARDRLAAAAQMARLSSATIGAMAASALVTRAAQAALPSAPDAARRAPILSAAARLATEEVALDAIRAVEQSVGLAHFADDSATGRKARDLSVYLRQAARDAFQTRVGEACFNEEDTLWDYI